MATTVVPISKRTGKRYAAGSRCEAGWRDPYPLACHVCGERVSTSGKTEQAHGGAVFAFLQDAQKGFSWHEDCWQGSRPGKLLTVPDSPL